jgi:hypothetical protein
MRAALLIAFVVTFQSGLMAQYVPPDFYGEPYSKRIGFWRNEGQVVDYFGDIRPDIEYYTDGVYPRMYMRAGSTVSFVLPTDLSDSSGIDTLVRIDMNLAGENSGLVNPIYHSMKTSSSNFYLPHCGAQGVSGVSGYNRIVYEDVYPFIDLHFYSGGSSQRMAWVVRPGGEPNDILMSFSGHDSLNVDIAGFLRLFASGERMVFPEAVAYQVTSGLSISPMGWQPEYQVVNGQGLVNINFGVYDNTLPLILQIGAPPNIQSNPLYCWSSYWGGDAEDYVNCSANLTAGGVIYGGSTFSSPIYFPPNVGLYAGLSPLQFTFISKFDANENLSWFVLYGSDQQVTLTDLEIDESGLDVEIYFAGVASSGLGLFVQPNSTAYYVPSSGGSYIAKLIDGVFSPQLQWSTYFGASNTFISGIGVSPAGELVAVGSTIGPGVATQVPTPPTYYSQPYGGGSSDAFLAKFNSSDELVWFTFYGGSEEDEARDVECWGNQMVVVGITESASFPIQTLATPAYSQPYMGFGDAFVSVISMQGVIEWSTFLGGVWGEWVSTQGGWGDGEQPLALNPTNGDIYLIGYTESPGFPYAAGTGWSDGVYNGNAQPFISQFSMAAKELLWSTYVGDDNQLLRAVHVTPDGRIVVGGQTSNASYPALNGGYYYFAGAPTPSSGGALTDGVITVFSFPNYMIHSTFYGGMDGVWGESVMTLTGRYGVELYCGGYTTKAPVAYGSYFPLFNNGGYYDDSYNDIPGQATSDGFVSILCPSYAMTDISEVDKRNSVSCRVDDSGRICISAAEIDSGTRLEIYDCTGRQIWTGNGAAVEDGVSKKSIPILSEGLYILKMGNDVYGCKFIMK